MLRIGMLGGTPLADLHLARYPRLGDRARVVALFDPDAGRAHAAAATLGHEARRHSGVEALLGDPEVDAVDICLPLPARTPAILAALGAGKPVLAAVPLCVSLEEASAIQRATQDSGTILMCAHHQLYEPAIGLASELLQQDALGTVYMARTTDCAKEEQIEAGELLHVGYHPAYVMRYLLGQNNQQPTTLSAALARNRRPEGAGEDGAQALIRFSGGAIGHLLTSRAFAMPPGFHTFHLIGAHGQVFGHKNVLFYLPTGAEAAERRTGDDDDAHAALLADFIGTVAARRVPLQGAADGRATLALALAAYRSAEKGITVPAADEKLAG